MVHTKLDILERDGYVILEPFTQDVPSAEWEPLSYLDWKSGGDTNVAVLASADGACDPRGFWDFGKPDKDGVWAPDSKQAPTLKAYVESIGARFGRVRIIKLNPSTSLEEVQSRYLHLDDNNRLNPAGTGWVVRSWLNPTDDRDSFMVLRDDRNDPVVRAADSAAAARAVRRRHRTAVACGLPPGTGAAVRAHHQPRVRAGARTLDRLAAAGLAQERP